MTKQQLYDFCIKNAGKMASGKYGIIETSSAIVRGRIIGFSIDRDRILLENARGQNKQSLPNPLPNIPYLWLGWNMVISPAKTGFPVLADRVVLDEKVPELGNATPQVSKIEPESLTKTSQSICEHYECDTGWCHRSYIGII